MKGVSGKVSLYDVRGIEGTYNVHLPDREEKPTPVKEIIPVRIRRLDQKTVTEQEIEARITHSSITSAILVLDHEIRQWENLQLLLLNRQMQPFGGEIHAKVVSVIQTDERFEAMIRFTLVSAEAYKVLRDGKMDAER
jgi:hypothetical protein